MRKLNEAEGPTAEVYNAVNKIRRRAQLLDLPANLTKDEMRNKIRQERRVELAFEITDFGMLDVGKLQK